MLEERAEGRDPLSPEDEPQRREGQKDLSTLGGFVVQRRPEDGLSGEKEDTSVDHVCPKEESDHGEPPSFFGLIAVLCPL